MVMVEWTCPFRVLYRSGKCGGRVLRRSGKSEMNGQRRCL